MLQLFIILTFRNEACSRAQQMPGSRQLIFVKVMVFSLFQFLLSVKCYLTDFITGLFISSSELSEYQNICIVIICAHM